MAGLLIGVKLSVRLINGAKTAPKRNNDCTYIPSWYCKNMNRSQAEQLLKSEVNPATHTCNMSDILVHQQIRKKKLINQLFKNMVMYHFLFSEQRWRLLGTGLKQSWEIHSLFADKGWWVSALSRAETLQPLIQLIPGL